MKTCIRCHIEKSFDEFFKDVQCKDGKTSTCKSCYRASYITPKKDKNKNHDCKILCGVEEQVCPICKESKLLIKFSIDKSRVTGHDCYCKSCVIVKKQKNAKQNIYHNCVLENCKDIIKYCKSCNLYHDLRFFPLRKCHPSSHAGCAIYNYKHHAASVNRIWSLSTELAIKIMSDNCIYCEKSALYERNGIDRLDSDLGYEIINVVPCCSICNQAKMEMKLDDFLNWLSRFRIDVSLIYTRIKAFQELVNKYKFDENGTDFNGKQEKFLKYG